jgi:GTPase SAR1 family protein
MDENNKKDDKKEKEKPDLFKICIFSIDEKIEQHFFEAIKVKPVFESSKKPVIVVDFVLLSYRRSKRFVFQIWSISNKSRFEIMIPNFILGSRGIIYFYDINDKIEENRLKLVKSGISPKIPILFVGYDTILPKKPEQSDDNIRLIKKYFCDFNSLYISVDKPDSWFQIVDKIISLDTGEGMKEGRKKKDRMSNRYLKKLRENRIHKPLSLKQGFIDLYEDLKNQKNLPESSIRILKIYKKMYWDCVIYLEIKALPKDMRKPRIIKAITKGLEGIRDEKPSISYEALKKQIKF